MIPSHANQLAGSRLRERGRPRVVPRIEARLGVLVEHVVLEQMARGRTLGQIAADLGVSAATIRRHLRRRGYRIECETRCVAIGSPPRPGR